MFLVKWVPILSQQTWILAKSSHFIESPFSLEHKIFRKKRSDRQFRCFCGEFCTLPVNHFHFAESPFYREKIAADFVQKFPFYRIPILSRIYCTRQLTIRIPLKRIKYSFVALPEVMNLEHVSVLPESNY